MSVQNGLFMLEKSTLNALLHCRIITVLQCFCRVFGADLSTGPDQKPIETDGYLSENLSADEKF